MRGIFSSDKYAKLVGLDTLAEDAWADDCDGCIVNDDGTMTGRDGITYRSKPEWEVSHGPGFVSHIIQRYCTNHDGTIDLSGVPVEKIRINGRHVFVASERSTIHHVENQMEVQKAL